MNLIEYEQHVRSLASKRDGQPIFNASVEHASIVIQNLFSEARGSHYCPVNWKSTTHKAFYISDIQIGF
jgi:hypothetical protein